MSSQIIVRFPRNIITETYVGKRYILLLTFDSEGEFRWLIFSEFKMHGEGHIKLYFDVCDNK
jgi:hypothetical protein